MVGHGDRLPIAVRLAAALGACLTLTGCFSDGSGPVTAASPMFRAEIGEMSGAVSPGPHAVWYVPRRPVRFVKIGVATWAAPARAGWLARLIRRRSSSDNAEPVALAAAGLALPAPSRVEVTNLATGRVATMRIETKAHMSDAIVRLPASAAAALGADPRQPLLVRVRYLAPLRAYQGRAPLHYALRSPRHGPVAEAPVRAAEMGPPPLVAARPFVLAVAAPASAKPARDLSQALRGTRPAPALAEAFGDVFRVQAGAFASRANAERAADRLEVAGAPTIEALRRGSLTLYRVVVAAPKAAGEAERLRARVAEVGFPDAWILQPL